MNWLYYLGEANLYLIVFYIGYCLFLSKETHYTLNRIYLLSSCVFAFVLPVLQLGVLKPHILLQASVVDPNLYPDGPELWQQNLVGIYVFGACLFFILFFVKLFRLWVIIRQSYISKMAKHKLIHIDESNTAFSFFNYLFIAEETEGVDFITHHELVHIRQKHSADIVFTELLKVISWFNPVIYLLQRSLKNVHEFIADEKTASAGNNRLEYSAFLINNAYGLSGTSITHSFFNNKLLKRRILMLNSERSGKLTALKYLLIVPLFAWLLCVSTLGFSKSYGWFDVGPQQQLPPPPPPTPAVTHTAPAVQPRKHKIDQVTFPPPKITRTKSKDGTPNYNVKIPPPVVKADPDSKTTKHKIDKVTFPPPVVKPAKAASSKTAERIEIPDPVVVKPAPKVVKFPPPVVKPAPKEVVKFPPPVVKPDPAKAVKPAPKAMLKLPPSMGRPTPKAVVKFPPPVVKPDPTPSKAVDKRPPPPPPEPPAGNGKQNDNQQGN